MKRYKKLKIRIPIPDEGSFGAIDIDSKMKEHPDGEWVRYRDVELILAVKPPDISIENIECSCQREYEQPTGIRNKGMIFFNAWICPAHGYKRL